jgi:hypothetical protein
MQDPSPAPLCLSQIQPHSLGVGVIVHNEPSQVLENFHPFQLLPVTREHTVKGLLGTCGSRMLTLPLPSSLAQPCVMVTSVEVLHRHLQSTLIALWQRLGARGRNANKILMMLHKKVSA